MLIGYARVSTDEQNLDLQIGALRNSGCEKIFQDHGVSGKTVRRPGLDQARKTLKRGDTLMVWRLDRLGRSLSHLIQTITKLECEGIHFRSLNENIDTSSSAGRLIFHIMGAMAEFEHALISERTRAGMKVARKRGIKIGRPALLCPEKREQIIENLRRGRSATELAKAFKVSPATIRRLRPSDIQAANDRGVSSAPSGALPRSTFSSASFDQWHDAVSVLYKPALEKPARADFRVDVDGFMLGDVSLTRCASVGQSFSRTESQIARDGIDNFMVQIFRAGQCRASAPRGDVIMTPGDVCIFDNTQTLDSYNEAFDLLAFSVPRHQLSPLLHAPEANHLACIDGGNRLAAMFSARLKAVYGEASKLSPDQAATVQSELVHLLAAAINGGHDMTVEQKAAVERSLFDEIRRHIDANLNDCAMGVQELAQRFGLPRTRLYRLFEAHGGVASYIRQRRLAFAHSQIVNFSAKRQSLGRIAASAGFASEKVFARHFEQCFGASPMQLRRERSLVLKRAVQTTELCWSGWLKR